MLSHAQSNFEENCKIEELT